MTGLRLTAGGLGIITPPGGVLQEVPGARTGAVAELPLSEGLVPALRMESLPLPFSRSADPIWPRGRPEPVVVIDLEGAIAGMLVERTVTVRGTDEVSECMIEPREILEAAGAIPGCGGIAGAARGEP